MKFATKAVHAGVTPDPTSGAIMTPIYQTSTYVQDAPGKHKGYEYARTHNPTRNALQESLAALENGKHGICFSSGLASLDAVLKLLKPGDEVISTNDLYGGSFRLMDKIFGRYGIKFSFVDLSKSRTLEDHLTDNTRMVWIETPTNPMVSIIDIKKCVDVCKGKNILVCVDNTFATPYLQRPLDLGADIVSHSATKYIGGHSDVVHGALVTNSQELAERFYFIQNAAGAVPGPQDCFLVLRGIKTLHLRVQRSCDNAKKIVQYLSDHSAVNKIFYPGLSSHSGHALATAQMSDYGAMISFTLNDDSIEAAHKVLSGTHLFALAESLGGVESLIGHPASMTHASIPSEERLKVGLTDSLIRLSVGVEDVDDLIEDLDKALPSL